MKILFPIIIYINGHFIVDDGSWYKLVGAKFNENGTFTTTKNLKRKIKSGWIIDYSGTYIELHAVGYKRNYMSFFSFLWNFVLSEYDIKNVKSITIKEMKMIMKLFPKYELNRKIVSDFLFFLDSQDGDTLLTKKILDKWPI